MNYFTGEQESRTGSRQEVVGGISTGKKGCHGEYVKVTTCATGQKKKDGKERIKRGCGKQSWQFFFLLFCFRKTKKCRRKTKKSKKKKKRKGGKLLCSGV